MDSNVSGKRADAALLPQLIAKCKYCEMISAEPGNRTPVHCNKFSGSAQPIYVNYNTCLSCKEYDSSPQ